MFDVTRRPPAVLEAQRQELEHYLRRLSPQDAEAYYTLGLVRPAQGELRGAPRWQPEAPFAAAVVAQLGEVPPRFHGALWRAVARLPPAWRCAVRLYIHEGLTFAAMASLPAREMQAAGGVRQVSASGWAYRYERGLTRLALQFWTDAGGPRTSEGP